MCFLSNCCILFFLILDDFHLANSPSEDIFGIVLDENRSVFFVESPLDLYGLFSFSTPLQRLFYKLSQEPVNSIVRFFFFEACCDIWMRSEVLVSKADLRRPVA